MIEIAPETVGLPVVERTVDRTELYACDEAFWCGSGQEIVPILSVDRIPVGAGRVGPITRALQERYFQIVRGESAEHRDWLTPVWGIRLKTRRRQPLESLRELSRALHARPLSATIRSSGRPTAAAAPRPSQQGGAPCVIARL